MRARTQVLCGSAALWRRTRCIGGAPKERTCRNNSARVAAGAARPADRASRAARPARRARRAAAGASATAARAGTRSARCSGRTACRRRARRAWTRRRWPRCWARSSRGSRRRRARTCCRRRPRAGRRRSACSSRARSRAPRCAERGDRSCWTSLAHSAHSVTPPSSGRTRLGAPYPNVTLPYRPRRRWRRARGPRASPSTRRCSTWRARWRRGGARPRRQRRRPRWRSAPSARRTWRLMWRGAGARSPRPPSRARGRRSRPRGSCSRWAARRRCAPTGPEAFPLPCSCAPVMRACEAARRGWETWCLGGGAANPYGPHCGMERRRRRRAWLRPRLL